MGKGRPSAERTVQMVKALTDAYEKLKSGYPTFDEITEKANKSAAIRLSKEGKIGNKTLIQSPNKEIKALRERIQSDKCRITELKALAPTELSIKIDQLHSSLGANSILAINIENLEKRLINKNEALEDKDTIITKQAKEIENLKAELRQRKG